MSKTDIISELLADEGEAAIITRAIADPAFAEYLYTEHKVVVSPTGTLVVVNRPFSETVSEATEDAEETAKRIAASISRGAGKVGEAIATAADVVTYNVVDKPIEGTKTLGLATRLKAAELRSNRIAAKAERAQRAQERKARREAEKALEAQAKLEAEQGTTPVVTVTEVTV